MGDYRADQLAHAAGMSLALVRSYQSKGLLDPPRRVGRQAFYNDGHLSRLRHIADLKSRGHSLRMIAEQITPTERTERRVTSDGRRSLRLGDVAERSGVPIQMLRSWEASGLIRPARVDGESVYDVRDIEAAQMILVLIGSGIPFERLIDVARGQLAAGAQMAEGAVRLLDEFNPIAQTPARDAAVREMAGVIGALVSYVVQSQVMAVGRDPADIAEVDSDPRSTG